MKTSHAILLALSVLVSCGLIAASNFAFNRYE